MPQQKIETVMIEKSGAKNSFGIIIPTNRLFEKSGSGNIKKPPIKPMIIEKKAVFSEIFFYYKNYKKQLKQMRSKISLLVKTNIRYQNLLKQL